MVFGGEALRPANEMLCFVGLLLLLFTGDGVAILVATGVARAGGATVDCERDTDDVGKVHEHIDPSSPNLYDTSKGSIHSVSSLGRYSAMLESPVTFAASLTTGSSRRPLILIQRYALPLLGLEVSQWFLYLSISSSSIRRLNGFVN